MLVATFAGHLAAPRDAGAQEHFATPGVAADYSRYKLPEQCLAAAWRVRDSVRWGDRRDTLPFDARESLPRAAVDVARDCVARFNAARVDSTSLPALRDLALAAGADSTAARAVARAIAAARRQSVARHAEVLSEAVHASLDARPIRLESARRYIAQLDSLGPQLSQLRFEMHSQLLNVYIAELNDLPAIARESDALLGIVRDVPAEIRAANPSSWLAYDQMTRLGLVMMTSLRDGPESGLAELAARGWSDGTVLGRRAPPITAPHWFARPDSAPRPRPGVLSMVVFVDHACGAECLAPYATLRRLARAHPDVEITLVHPTRGFFGSQPPPTSAEEAELTRQYMKEHHKLPGALAVSPTSFTRLDALDGRRIEQPETNLASYGLAGSLQLSGTVGTDALDYFLVGPDGIIDFTGWVLPEQERFIAAQIDAIVRGSGGSAGGTTRTTP